MIANDDILNISRELFFSRFGTKHTHDRVDLCDGARQRWPVIMHPMSSNRMGVVMNK